MAAAIWLSVSAVEMATLGWVDWFNNYCLFELIVPVPLAEDETRQFSVLQTLDIDA